MRHAWSSLLAVVCVALACRAPTRAAPLPSDSASAQPQGASESAVPRLDLVHRTLGGSAGEPLPWIVAFHGLGDTPENFSHLFDDLSLRAHVYLPRAPLAYGSGYDWFGARVGDHEALTRGIQSRLPLVAELIRSLAADSRNRGDAVVTGFSQGGILSFAIAAADLSHVKVALPLAGWLPAGLAAKPRMKVIAFHGEADAVVPFAATQTLVQTWLGHDDTSELVVFRTYPALQHRVSGAMKRDWEIALQAAVSTEP